LLADAVWAGPGAGRGLLFAVEHPDHPPSYLFGTIHSDDPRVTALPPAVEDALDRSRVIVSEVEMDETSLEQSMSALLMKNGRELSSVLPPDLYDRTLTAAASLGLSEAAVRYCKPWAVVTLISVPPPVSGRFLDLEIAQLGRAKGKTVLGLETIREQFAAFDALAEEDQIELLRSTLAHQERLPSMQEELIRAYLRRSLQELVDLNHFYMDGFDAALSARIIESIIDERNARMVERLLPLLEEGPAFVAVGALHLPGRNGMLALLEAEGFRVSAVY